MVENVDDQFVKVQNGPNMFNLNFTPSLKNSSVQDGDDLQIRPPNTERVHHYNTLGDF